MKKMYCLLLALIVSQVNFAQEKEPQQETPKRKREFTVNLGAGFATLEMEDVIKFNTNLYQSSFLYTFPLGSSFGLETGLSLHTLSGDFSLGGYSYYSSNNFVSVPVTLKLETGDRFRYFSALSVRPQYMISNEFEAYGADENPLADSFGDNRGGSLLLGAMIGGKFPMNERVSFDCGISLYGDLFQFGYDDDKTLKTTNMVAIHIGLSIF